jgi:hypothetical protein
MDYEQINKHFECMEYLHDLTMALEIVKVLSQDISNVQYNVYYNGRLQLARDEFDHSVSFYKRDESDTGGKLHNNFIMRNSMNTIQVSADHYSCGGDVFFNFCDIRNEIVELCNTLIANYNKDK